MSQVRRTKTVPNVLAALARSNQHLRRLGERMVYVGTVGSGDVPDDSMLTELSTPFSAGVTNAQGGRELVSWVLRSNTWLTIRGVPAALGSAPLADGQDIFRMPAGFWPLREQGPFAAVDHVNHIIGGYVLQVDGFVVWHQVYP